MMGDGRQGVWDGTREAGVGWEAESGMGGREWGGRKGDEMGGRGWNGRKKKRAIRYELAKGPRSNPFALSSFKVRSVQRRGRWGW